MFNPIPFPCRASIMWLRVYREEEKNGIVRLSFDIYDYFCRGLPFKSLPIPSAIRSVALFPVLPSPFCTCVHRERESIWWAAVAVCALVECRLSHSQHGDGTLVPRMCIDMLLTIFQVYTFDFPFLFSQYQLTFYPLQWKRRKKKKRFHGFSFIQNFPFSCHGYCYTFDWVIRFGLIPRKSIQMLKWWNFSWRRWWGGGGQHSKSFVCRSRCVWILGAERAGSGFIGLRLNGVA
jgi:hypothetical protein